MSDSVLITGASSGIGLSAVNRFYQHGYRVVATVRSSEDESTLQKAFPDIQVLNLDLRREKDVNAVIGGFLQENNGVDIVINNAGYACIGAVEELTMDQWRSQMETNFFAVVNICTLAIPYMRKKGVGRIVQVSSGVGQFVVPIFSPYCTSKHALETFSEALRYEVGQFGIGVSLIAPGPVESKFDANREVPGEEVISQSPYRKLIQAMRSRTQKAHQRESSPEDVVDKIFAAATGKNPKLRYEVGMLGYAALLPKFIPASLLEAGMRFSSR